jgi:protein SCO1/2
MTFSFRLTEHCGSAGSRPRSYLIHALCQPGGQPSRAYLANYARSGTALRTLIVACSILAGALAVTACRGSKPNEEAVASRTYPEGAYPVKGTQDCLSGATLTDQHGRTIVLDSLKGKLVLIDFIYTSCPGPCEMMTAKIAAAARELKERLGKQVAIVSVTLDPEHDKPDQLLKFAREQGAEQPGWLFLTGSPEQIEALMARFRLKRQREPDGSIDHVTIIYLLGRDGREVRIYNTSTIKSARLAADINAELAASG